VPKKKTAVRKPWTKEDLKHLKAHSKARTPAVDVAKAMRAPRRRSGKRPRRSKLVSGIVVEDCHYGGSPISGGPLSASVCPGSLRFARPAIKVVGTQT
jgi:hypothetical protein